MLDDFIKLPLENWPEIQVKCSVHKTKDLDLAIELDFPHHVWFRIPGHDWEPCLKEDSMKELQKENLNKIAWMMAEILQMVRVDQIFWE